MVYPPPFVRLEDTVFNKSWKNIKVIIYYRILSERRVGVPGVTAECQNAALVLLEVEKKHM